MSARIAADKCGYKEAAPARPRLISIRVAHMADMPDPCLRQERSTKLVQELHNSRLGCVLGDKGVIRIETTSTVHTDWDGLVMVASPGLMKLAYMLCGNQHAAEDLLQATFARAWRHSERIAAMAAPAAYLRRIMINEHSSQHRRRQLATVPLDADLDPAAPTASRADDRDEAWRWLATLPPRQRTVLVLRFYEDVPDQKIAQLIGCTQATVRSHASHGLAALRTLLTDGKEGS